MRVILKGAELDLDQMTVRRDGQTDRLTRQVAQILRVLLENPGAAVSKEALIDVVWGGRVVTDATLSTAMKEARRAVGDTGKTQAVIKTMHGVGFRLIAPVERPRKAPPPKPALPKVAVLPFRNIGGTPADDFIGDGLTDELISNLSCFRDFLVLSRNTSEHIAADHLGPAEMREAFGIDFVIEGNVRRSSDRLRVTVQVASTASGAIVMTEQFNRDATVQALFDVQDQIATLCAGRVASPHGEVAREMGVRAAEQAPLTSWRMYRLVAEFRRFYRTYDPDLHAYLRTALPAALAEDPAAADGWAAYAVILLEEHRYHVNERPGLNALPLATDAAERAVAADPRNAFAHVALAMCRLFALDVAGFDAAAAQALTLNPNNADVLSEIGHCYAFLAREDEAIAMLDQAMALSPVHPGWYHFAKSWRYARLGLFEAALVEVQKGPMPGFYWYHAHLVWFYAALDRVEEARAEAAVLRDVFPEFEARAYEELTLWSANQDLVASALDAWGRAGLRVVMAPVSLASSDR